MCLPRKGITMTKAKTNPEMRESLENDLRDSITQIYGETTDFRGDAPAAVRAERDFKDQICRCGFNVIQGYSALELKQKYNELKTQGNGPEFLAALFRNRRLRLSKINITDEWRVTSKALFDYEDIAA